mgnify:CR=1 FL=1
MNIIYKCVQKEIAAEEKHTEDTVAADRAGGEEVENRPHLVQNLNL